MDKRLTELVGTPFAYGGRGPDAFDCYGLVRECYRRARGIELPDFTTPAGQALISASMLTQIPTWREVPVAAGATLALRIGRFVSHCGYMLDAEHMLHAWEHSGGVTIVNLSPDWSRRIVGAYEFAPCTP